MKKEEVIALIKAGFPNAKILAEGADCNFSCIVICSTFEGLSLLKRQKAVLATVKEQITRGELHAMSIKTYTPEQWEQMQAE